ncbi:MAG: DedA family protein [candidate division SR1 bacterium]|nr:DedA family protein [candidate division SR1 bacterium]
MYEKLFEGIVALFLTLGEHYGYLAIFIGALADSLIPIVPSEIVFGSAGFWAYKGYINLVVAVIIAVLGNLIASALFWYLGKKYGHNYLIIWGKYLGFNSKDMAKSEKIFEKWGYWSVFVCQFIPLFRSLISIPSGILELNFRKFMFATALGASIWNAILMILAYNLGENWSQIGDIISKVGKPLFYIATLVLIALATKIIYSKYLKQRLSPK